MNDASKSPKPVAPVYPPVEASPSFPKIEEAVETQWTVERTFQKSIDRRRAAKAPEYVFYDGPPFANGLPHYGHIVTGFVKDLVPRYQTMRGKVVERRFGWDCHGLPAELHSESELKLAGRRDIVKYGVARFNEHCRTSIMQFRHDWEYYVNRSARWVDFDNDYRTMDLSYMESVMWAFKQLWDKGLVYEGFRVVPYSWMAQTPLSQSETRLDDSYRMRQDPALTVAFQLDKLPNESVGPKLLAWTTTPWTLPSNMGLAVKPDADYALLEKGHERLIIAEASLEKYQAELGEFARIATITGAELVGRTYAPLFPFFAAKKAEGAFRVIPADFIELGEGTGVVHMAPAFGEDDLTVGQREGLPVVDPVDMEGNFTELAPPYKGKNVFAANKDIIRDLKAAGVVVRHETYDHSYPHSWRTDEPLIYKAMPSWYVKVTAIRDRMVELNRDITWMPAHIRDGVFGNWLANARDWNIGRNRFWGAPIPVWKSDDPKYPRIDVYGSLDELERDFGVRPKDLHRPYVDELTRPNPDDPTGKSTMRRVEDVLDCWFESGSMPFAQVHYPFENRAWFEGHFPGDFIVEYVGQTRGWFYNLMVLSTALFDKAPFRNAICHGVVLDENKQKLSKRLKNYPDPIGVFNTYGADALRWYMVSSPLLSGGDLAMPKDGKAIGDAVKEVLLPIWNAYSFFTLYANIDGVRGKLITTAEGELDRYILGKTAELVRAVEAAMDRLDLAAACNALPSYIEALNNWYIRRSRDRFWASGSDAGKTAAYDTLYTVLVTLCRTMAPFLPHITEHIHRALCDGESVHLQDWPDASAFQPMFGPMDATVTRMDLVRAACSAAASIRTAKNLRNRLPLSVLTIAHPAKSMLMSVSDVIKDEANVKRVEFADDPREFGAEVLAINPRMVGKRLGKAMQAVLAEARAGEWKRLPGGAVEVSGNRIEPGEYELRFAAKPGIDAMSFDGNAGVVVLDTTVDKDLELEGCERDLIRAVQVGRKEAGLKVSDHIDLEISGGPLARQVIDIATGKAIARYSSTIRTETLADSVTFTSQTPRGHVSTVVLGDETVTLGIRKASTAADALENWV